MKTPPASSVCNTLDPEAIPLHAQVSEGKTLLIVDDESAVRELMEQVLCQEGYNVLQAAGAAEALRLATDVTIDLLLTDYSMPGTDGLELTRRFRTLYPRAPVLMVSGALVGLNGRSEHLDRFEILQKPFAVVDLITKVRTLLSEPSLLPTGNALSHSN
jgi:DNA-binding response OmpR family regulator